MRVPQSGTSGYDLSTGRVSCTGTRSRGILHRQPAINNKLAPKPTPKPNSNPTQALTLTLPLTLTLS